MFHFNKVDHNNISELKFPFEVVGEIPDIYFSSLDNQENQSVMEPPQIDHLFLHVFQNCFYLILELPDFYLDEIKNDFKTMGISFKVLEKDKAIFLNAEIKTKEQALIAAKYSLLLGNMNYLVIWSNEINLIKVELVNRSFLLPLFKRKSIKCEVATTENTTFIWFAHDLSGVFLFSNDNMNINP